MQNHKPHKPNTGDKDGKNLGMLAVIAGAVTTAVATGWLKQKAEDQKKADALYAEEEAQHQQQQEADRQHQRLWENEQRRLGDDLRAGQMHLQQEVQRQQRFSLGGFLRSLPVFVIRGLIVAGLIWVIVQGVGWVF